MILGVVIWLFFNRFPRLYALVENQQSRVCDYWNESCWNSIWKRGITGGRTREKLDSLLEILEYVQLGTGHDTWSYPSGWFSVSSAR